MKRYSLVAVILISWVAVFSGVGSSLAKECSRLRVGSTNQWYPMCYIDPDTGAAKGIAHEFIYLLAERLGLSVSIVADLPWKRTLRYAEQGRLDCLAAVYWTSERAEKFRFTEPYAFNEARLFVRTGKEFPFDSLADLRGKRGGIPPGGSFGEAFDTYAREHQLDLIGVETKDQRVAMLLSGRIDYFVQDYLDAMIYLQQRDLTEEITALPRQVSRTGVHLAFSRNSPCTALIPKINAIIRQSMEDGSLETIIQRNLPR